MATLSAWLRDENGRLESPDVRAVRAWNRINDKPTSIVVKRNGTIMAAQTVRLEYAQGGLMESTNIGSVGSQSVTVYGILSHPVAANTDIKIGDRFVYGGKEYEIKSTIITIGEIQGQAEAIT